MWFKQLQVFQLPSEPLYSVDTLLENLNLLAFQPCLPSMNTSVGWVSPIDEAEAPLVRMINGCIMICLQIEEKILPNIVIKQALANKIKDIEIAEDRRIRHKEKLSLKDEITMTLLPRAFSKLTKIYGYIDTKNHWLVIGTSQTKKVDQFISLFKKSVSEQVKAIEVEKISPVLTDWIKTQNFPTHFSIEKSCLLQDEDQQNRTIRCKHQDLFAVSIQSLIKDGCVIKQLALAWQDRVEFVLHEGMSLQSIKFQDKIKEQAKEMEPETKQQCFDTDFLIMAETLSALLSDLFSLFLKSAEKISEKAVPIPAVA